MVQCEQIPTPNPSNNSFHPECSTSSLSDSQLLHKTGTSPPSLTKAASGFTVPDKLQNQTLEDEPLCNRAPKSNKDVWDCYQPCSGKISASLIDTSSSLT